MAGRVLMGAETQYHIQEYNSDILSVERIPETLHARSQWCCPHRLAG